MKNYIYYRKISAKYQVEKKDYVARTHIRPRRDIFTRYIILLKSGLLRLKIGFPWNGASGPTWDDKTNMRASGEHDALCELVELGLLPRKWLKEINRRFWGVCRRDGMKKARAKAYHIGGSIGAHIVTRRNKKAGKIYRAP